MLWKHVATATVRYHTTTPYTSAGHVSRPFCLPKREPKARGPVKHLLCSGLPSVALTSILGPSWHVPRIINREAGPFRLLTTTTRSASFFAHKSSMTFALPPTQASRLWLSKAGLEHSYSPVPYGGGHADKEFFRENGATRHKITQRTFSKAHTTILFTQYHTTNINYQHVPSIHPPLCRLPQCCQLTQTCAQSFGKPLGRIRCLR